MLDRGSPRPEFLSTPSARRATACIMCKACRFVYFYPRPPRGGRLVCAKNKTPAFVFLSTPSARRATARMQTPSRSILFLSTPSARRATRSAASPAAERYYFYPRPPRGGRQTHGNKAPPEYRFLSTPSARRATSCGAYHQSVRHYFYPRPPRGGRPDGAGHGRRTCCISIHALREEGDFLRGQSSCARRNFYPRPPRGGRPLSGISVTAAR